MALEVQYGKYDAEERSRLSSLAAEYGLLESCGSDFHGHLEDEGLFKGQFSEQLFEALEKKREQLIMPETKVLST